MGCYDTGTAAGSATVVIGAPTRTEKNAGASQPGAQSDADARIAGADATGQRAIADRVGIWLSHVSAVWLVVMALAGGLMRRGCACYCYGERIVGTRKRSAAVRFLPMY